MFLEKFRLDGKAALVTGGSRGLGLEAALALKEAGARVAVVARRASFFEEARKALGEDALYLEGDVRDEARLEAIAEEVEERLKGHLPLLEPLRAYLRGERGRFYAYAGWHAPGVVV